MLQVPSIISFFYGLKMWSFLLALLFDEKPILKTASLLFRPFQVIMEAVNKPRNIHYKGVADLVTE
jgi:hypothetical protein